VTRLFRLTGLGTTLLLVAGLVASGLQPGQEWPEQLIHAGLLMLMVTPVTRVVVACVGYVREGDRLSALLTAAILVLVAAGGYLATR
jgi:uncharacterized membrane protein